MKNTVKVERARHDMSQSDLAEKIGASRQAIYLIEKGKFVPSTVLALKISSVFGLPVNELFELEEKDWD
ncbi:MAG: helix-turn-helix transcriptional regulator [Bacteroidota bacterium]